MKLKDIKPNPNNPRLIKDHRFEKLVNNVKTLPKMMRLRPMILDENNMVLGGNQRLKALKHLGYKEIPDNWVAYADDFTPEEINQLIILDNIGFGEHDWNILANEWDETKLIEWGIHTLEWEGPEKEEEPKPKTPVGEEFKLSVKCVNEKEKSMLAKELINKGYEVKL